MDSYKNNISAIVATHNRPLPLKQMIDSLHNYYPNIPIIIIDSSYKTFKEKFNYSSKLIKHLYIEHDAGISKQRNIALDLIRTELFILLDDDYIFTEKTDLNKLHQEIRSNCYDIVGGSVKNLNCKNFDFHGNYYIFNNVLYHFVDFKAEEKEYDTIFNFFLAKKDCIEKLGVWDNNLKYAREHDDFFLNLKKSHIKVGYKKDIPINHIHYKKYHSGENSKNCVKYFCKKRNIYNKIEIRLILDKNETYISYHNCIEPSINIPTEIKEITIEKYGNFFIKIT